MTWWALARHGDRLAFDELVRRTHVETYTLAFRLTADEEDARDVVQEAYLRAWKGIPSFRGDAQFTTWMYRITANTAYTAVKRRRRHRAEPLDSMLEEPVELHPDVQPEDAAESSALLDRLSVALDELAAEAARARRAEGRVRALARGDRRGARHLGGRGEGAAPPRAQAAA